MVIIDKRKIFQKKRDINSTLEKICERENMDSSNLKLIKETNGPKNIDYMYFIHNNGNVLQLNYHNTINNKDFIGILYPINSKRYNYYNIFLDSGEIIP